MRHIHRVITTLNLCLIICANYLQMYFDYRGLMVKLNNFGVDIPQGHELDSGYVLMKHNTVYTIVLRNYNSFRCDAAVEVDGKNVGVWRIPQDSCIVLERPIHDEGKFTFYRIDSSEAILSEITKKEHTGLITVLFKPEKINLHHKNKTYQSDISTNKPWWERFFGGKNKSMHEVNKNGFKNDDFDEPLFSRRTSRDGGDIMYKRRDNITGNKTSSTISAGGTGLSGQSLQKFKNAEAIEYDTSSFVAIHLRLVCEYGNPRPLTASSTPIPPAI